MMKKSVLQSFVLLALCAALATRADAGNNKNGDPNAVAGHPEGGPTQAEPVIVDHLSPLAEHHDGGNTFAPPKGGIEGQASPHEIELIINDAIQTGLKHGLQHALGIPLDDDTFTVSPKEIGQIEKCVGHQTLNHLAGCIHQDLTHVTSEAEAAAVADPEHPAHAEAVQRLQQCITPEGLEHIGQCIDRQQLRHLHRDERIVDAMDESELLRLAEIRHEKDVKQEHFEEAHGIPHRPHHPHGLTQADEHEEELLVPMFTPPNALNELDREHSPHQPNFGTQAEQHALAFAEPLPLPTGHPEEHEPLEQRIRQKHDQSYLEAADPAHESGFVKQHADLTGSAEEQAILRRTNYMKQRPYENRLTPHRLYERDA